MAATAQQQLQQHSRSSCSSTAAVEAAAAAAIATQQQLQSQQNQLQQQQHQLHQLRQQLLKQALFILKDIAVLVGFVPLGDHVWTPFCGMLSSHNMDLNCPRPRPKKPQKAPPAIHPPPPVFRGSSAGLPRVFLGPGVAGGGVDLPGLCSPRCSLGASQRSAGIPAAWHGLPILRTSATWLGASLEHASSAQAYPRILVTFASCFGNQKYNSD